MKKLGDNEYSLIYNEEEHFFSKSKIEVLCQKDLASLSAEELKSITAEKCYFQIKKIIKIRG